MKKLPSKKTGKPFKVALRNLENVVSLKSIWLDIDAKGGENSYDSAPEAVADFKRWCRDSSAPWPNMVVMSGGGIHAYWETPRALTIDEWLPRAHALVEATKRHGLKCDTGVTTDAARVLRIPNTWNCKQGERRPVRLLVK